MRKVGGVGKEKNGGCGLRWRKQKHGGREQRRRRSYERINLNQSPDVLEGREENWIPPPPPTRRHLI